MTALFSSLIGALRVGETNKVLCYRPPQIFLSRLLILYLLIFGFNTHLSAISLSAESSIAFDYLNKVRRQAGLPSFTANKSLETAAINHAEYLSMNRVIGHVEENGNLGFTGHEPQDRAVTAGYDSRDVAENFSAGQPNAVESVDGLMSAIYHRLGFLDLRNDELGIGITSDQEGLKYVYVMGSQPLNQLCRYLIYNGEIPFYENVCKRDVKVPAPLYDQKINKRLKESPKWVIWPTRNATDVPVAFYEEIPDPLPDIPVSGYPVSIQLNPYYYRQVKLLAFQMFDELTGVEISETRLLDLQTDPNQRLKPTEFALFPLNRLNWDTVYRVNIKFQVNRSVEEIRWSFRTESLGMPVFQLTGQHDRVFINPGKQYAIYLPPSAQHPFIERLRWESVAGIETNVEKKDRNTLTLSIKGELCSRVYFYLDEDRSFIAQLSQREGTDQLDPDQDDQISECAFSVIKELPGYQINGNEEEINVTSRQAYWVKIQDLETIISSVKWRGSANLKVEVEYIDRDILKIKLSGRTGQYATFFIDENKSFTARIEGR